VTTSDDVAREYLELADLLEEAPASLWDAPSLCVGWRTREVVAHMTMSTRLSESEFMTELRAAGGDFTKLSNTVAVRDGALAPTALLADLRSPRLHRWKPPGGEHARTHSSTPWSMVSTSLRPLGSIVVSRPRPSPECSYSWAAAKSSVSTSMAWSYGPPTSTGRTVRAIS
jgi:hypothetical protein